MRYVQVSNDLNEISGLGLINIKGIATFDKPATFHVKHRSQNATRITTNTGLSLTNQWLNGRVRCIEAFALDNQWLDVTARCQSGSIPTQLVQEWSDRNQRTLVDFRISI
jgi:hypothetical protein